MTTIRVLVVDDSALMRKALTGMLAEAAPPGGARFEVRTARNGADALEQIRRERPDVVTLDINMPEMDGLTCLAALMATTPVPVVMVSSLTEDGAASTLEALELGAVDVVHKPGGTVSLNIATVAEELAAKVALAARAQVRPAVPAPRQPEQVPAGPRHTDLVLIGSSTGGPKALRAVLGGLPAGYPAPIVIAQHIAESFTPHLASRLSAAGPLPVTQVTGTTPLRPGRVYLGGGTADLVIARSAPDGLMVKPVPPSASYRWHPSVDRLVTSAMRCVEPSRLLGVLLTGMGDDGAESLADVHAGGGRTIAESADTAVVHGMPAELEARGGAGAVLPLPQIAQQMLRWT